MGDLSHTVSGNIASFRTPSRVPIESLKFHFLPKQADGTPSPENPIPIEGWTGVNGKRCHKNLYNYNIDNFELVEFNNGSGTMIQRQIYHTGLKNGVFTASAIIKSGYSRPSYNLFNIGIYSNGTVTNINTYIGTNEYKRTFTLSSNQELVIVSTTDSLSNSNYNIQHYDIQIEVGSNNTTIEPYSGEVMPIVFPVAGTNKLNPNDIIIHDNHFTLENGVYKNAVTDTRTTIQLAVQLWKTTGTYIKTLYVDYLTTTGRHSLTFTVDDPNGHYICLKHNGKKKDFILLFPWTFGLHQFTISLDVLANDPTTVGGVQLTNIQLEPGDTSHAYEPYSSDNTFYGGYIDSVAGEIVTEYALYETTWGAGSTGTVLGDTKRKGFYVGSIEFADAIDLHNNGQGPYGKYRRTLCNIVPWGWDYFSDYPHYYINNHDIILMMPVDTSDDMVIQFCAWLKTPIHIPIPAQDLQAFLDHNNFWSDANDITEVTYDVYDSNMILQTKKNIIAENSKHYRKVLWNQWLPPLDENGWKAYTTSYTTATFSNGVATNTWLTDNTGYSASIRDKNGTVQHAGEIWYASYMVKTSTSNLQWGIEMCGGNQLRFIVKTQPDTWHQCSAVSAYNRGTTNYTYICNLSTSDGDQTGIVAQVTSPILVNLTAMFGPGNEPTKKEFEALCKINHVDLTQYQPQTSGTEQIWCIPSINLDDYTTVEWNQWARPVTSDYYKPYNNNNISVTVEDGIITQTWLTKAIDYNAAVCSPVTKTHQANRYYYLSYEYCADFAGYIGGTVGGQSAYNYNSTTIPNQWDRFSCLVKRTEGGTYQNYVVYLGRFTNSTIEIGSTCLLKNPIAIDITQMFGAGNEPKSAAEFEYLCTINNINLTEYHAYNTGTKMIWKI